jgi:hypothetical protein
LFISFLLTYTSSSSSSSLSSSSSSSPPPPPPPCRNLRSRLFQRNVHFRKKVFRLWNCTCFISGPNTFWNSDQNTRSVKHLDLAPGDQTFTERVFLNKNSKFWKKKYIIIFISRWKWECWK